MRSFVSLALLLLAFLVGVATAVAQEPTETSQADTVSITLSGSLSLGMVYADSPLTMPSTGAVATALAGLEWGPISLDVSFTEEITLQIPMIQFGELDISGQYNVVDTQIGDTFLIEITSGPGFSTDLGGFMLSWTIEADATPVTTAGVGSGGASITSTVAAGPTAWEPIFEADLDGYYTWVPLGPGESTIVLSGGVQTEFPGLWISPWMGVDVTWEGGTSAAANVRVDDLFGSTGYVIGLAFGLTPWEVHASTTIDTQGGLLVEGGFSWNWDVVLGLPQE